MIRPILVLIQKGGGAIAVPPARERACSRSNRRGLQPHHVVRIVSKGTQAFMPCCWITSNTSLVSCSNKRAILVTVVRSAGLL